MTITADRVKETTASTATPFTVAATTGFQTFNTAFGIGPTFFCAVVLNAQWQVGIAHLTDATTLAFDSVSASSAGGAPVTFAAGTKAIFATLPGAAISAAGFALIDDADASAMRATLGLGTAATAAAGDFDAAGSAAAAQAAAIAASQPVDSDLTAIAALSTTAFGRGLLTLADAAAGRTALALGTAATSNIGGSTTQVQYNDAGAFGASSNFTYDAGTNTVTFGSITGSALAMTIQPRAPTVLEDAGTMQFVGRNAVKANSNGGSISFIAGNKLGTGTQGEINFSITGSGTAFGLSESGVSITGNVGESFGSTIGNFVFTGPGGGNNDQPMQFFAGVNLASDGNTPIEFYTDSGIVFQVGETAFGTQQISLFGNALTGRSTGWGAPTGTATKTTFATTTVTTEQLAQRVKAIIDYLLLRGDFST